MTTTIFPPILAELSNAALAEAAPAVIDYPLVRALLIIVLILVNAVFVAAEFALIKVHVSQLEEAVADKKKGAEATLALTENLSTYLITCQVVVSFLTILVGALGAPFLTDILSSPLSGLGISEQAIRIVSFFVGILILTAIQTLAGEQIPRAFGTRRSVETSIACTPALRIVRFLAIGPVWLVETLSDWVLKYFFRLDTSDTPQQGATADDLRLLVEETGRTLEVTETEREILRNALELNELCVRDILTPRNEVVVLDVHRTFRENLDIALESKHTRFPLVDNHLDKTLGLIHIKDLLREMQKDSMNLFAVKRDLMRVSEHLPLDEMLQLFLSKRAHMALVVDEFGGSVGLVMLDDVLDQVVGEIHDEFDDEEEVGFRRVSDDEFIVEGWFPLHELSDEVNELDLEAPDVSTIGGYMISQLGRIPEPGETAQVEGFEAEIVSADERTVQQIRFTRIEEASLLRSNQESEEGEERKAG